MFKPDFRVSLAELSDAGVRLRPFEAVTIVRELVVRVARGEIPGVPSAHVIRIDSSGQLFVEGPVAAGERSVSRAAQLLDSLLPSFDAGPEFKVRGALRLVIARGLGALDVPPYESLEAFAGALERFSVQDPRQVIRELAQSWSAAVERSASPAPASAPNQPPGADQQEEAGSDAPAIHALPAGSGASEAKSHALVPVEPQVSISDIRRARRATGLPLAEVSTRCRIPVPLLRQLEWGYLRHWPAGVYGRTQLVRYARAAGLDEKLVVATVWPMLEGAVRERPATAVVDAFVADTFDTTALAEIPLERAPSSFPGTVPRRRLRVAAWLAVAAALLIALVPLVRMRLDSGRAGVAEKIAQNLDPGPGGKASAPIQESIPIAAGPAAPAATERSAPPDVAAVRAPSQAFPRDAAPARGLTDDAAAYSPTFASVGSAMFYHAENRAGSALMRAETDAEGSILRIIRVVDDHSRNYHARPSPDGTRIAFDSDREGERAVYIANADGTNVRKVSGEGFASVPSWSPDGRQLAFVRAEPDRPKVWNLWLLDLASGEMRRLTAHSVGQPWGGSWFPDGRRIAYSHEDRLVILDLETGRERVYRSPRKGQLVRTPAVSPDGRLVVFQVFRDGAWLLDLADGSMRKVLADPSAEEYTWSPDGRRVAYHSRRTGSWGVWLMTAR